MTQEQRNGRQQELPEDRLLTEAESVEQGKQLLTEGKDTLKNTPEFAQALVSMFFDPHGEIPQYAKRGARFSRGGNGYDFHYNQDNSKNKSVEGLGLTRGVPFNRKYDIEGIAVNVLQIEGEEKAAIVYFQEKHHEWSAPTYPVYKHNTRQAVHEVRRFLNDFRTTGNNPKPQSQ